MVNVENQERVDGQYKENRKVNSGRCIFAFFLIILVVSLALGFWFLGGKKYLSFQKSSEISISFSNRSKYQGSLSEVSQNFNVIEVKCGMFYFDPS